MKIRRSFVTNSSSTSFCIMGGVFNADKVAGGKDLTVEYSPYDDITYVGLSATNMKDDETLSDFKVRALKTINEARAAAGFDLIESVSWHEGCWYDG